MSNIKLTFLECLFLFPICFGGYACAQYNGCAYWLSVFSSAVLYTFFFRKYINSYKKIIIKENDNMHNRITGIGKNLADDKAAILPMEKK